MILGIFDPLASPATAAALAAALTLIKMTLVLLAALAVTLAMRRAPAGARHLVWLVALATMLLIPVVSAWGPVSLPVLPQVASKTLGSPVATASLSTPTPAQAPTPPVLAASSTTSPGPASTPAAAPRSFSVGALMLAIWALGILILLGKLALGAWSVRRIVRGARVLDRTEWRQPLYEIADRLGLRDAPELLQSDRITIPFASGLWRSRIVLPVESQEWSEERRSAVLMHELGHVRRRDLVGHTLSRIVCALYWFHPLVWTAAQRLRAESERACDDLALGLGVRPSDYAEHLLDIVSGVRDRRTPAVALAMANPNEFEGRMLAILDPRIPRRGLRRAHAAWLAGTLAALALVVGAMAPVPRTTATAGESTPPGPDAVHVAPQVVSRVERKSQSKTTVRRETRTKNSSALEESTEPMAPIDATEAIAMATAEDSDTNGDTKDQDGSRRIAALAKALRTDSNVEVRRVAAWGLERFAESDQAADPLAAALGADAAEEVREMAAWALSESRGNAAAMAALQKAFKNDKSRSVRRTAAWAAGEIGDRSSVAGLISLLADTDADIREVAAWAIGSCEPEKAPAELVRLLSDPNRDVRLSVAWALSMIEDPETADELEAAFNREKDPEVQQGLIHALGSMGDRAIDTLTRLVGSSNPEIRAVAVAALAGGNVSGPWPWPRPEPRPYP